MAKSLLEGGGFEAIGKKAGGKAKSARSGTDTIKLVAAVVLLLLAGTLIAWYAGVLPSGKGSGKNAGTQLTAQEQESFKQQEEQRKRDALRKDVEIGGS